MIRRRTVHLRLLACVLALIVTGAPASFAQTCPPVASVTSSAGWIDAGCPQ